MTSYKVFFQRTTQIELYLTVEANSLEDARRMASEATSKSDDCLTEIPESYSFDCGPTGEVTETDPDDEE